MKIWWGFVYKIVSNMWIILLIVFTNGWIEFTQAACTGDTAGEIQDGQTCSQLVAADDANCYDSNIETLCCDSCASVASGNPACQYGDHITCYDFLCTSYNPVSQCCLTCIAYMPTTTVAPTPAPTTTAAAPPTTTVVTSGPVTSSAQGSSGGASTENGDNQGGVIAGAVLGALLGVALCVVTAVVLFKIYGRKSRRNRKVDPDDGSASWGSETSIRDKGAPPDRHPSPSQPPPLPSVTSHSPIRSPGNRRSSDLPPLPFRTDGNFGGMIKPVPPIGTLYKKPFMTSDTNVLKNDVTDPFADMNNDFPTPIPEKSVLSVGTLGSLQFQNGASQNGEEGAQNGEGAAQNDEEAAPRSNQTGTDPKESKSTEDENASTSASFTSHENEIPSTSVDPSVQNDVSSHHKQQKTNVSAPSTVNVTSHIRQKPSGFLFPDL